MVKLSWADHLRMEATQQKKSASIDPQSVDFYDTDILEKTSYYLKTDVKNRKPTKNHGAEDLEFELEFHEQFFS